MSLRPIKVDFDTLWPGMLATAEGVVTCGSVSRAVWNERFSDVYKMCTAVPEPLGEKLYWKTKEFFENHVQHLYADVEKLHGTDVLLAYHRYWEAFSKGAGFLNCLYGYLNTTIIKKQKYNDIDLSYKGYNIVQPDTMVEIGELALDVWKRFMIAPQMSRLASLLLEEISAHRHGMILNEPVIKGTIRSFVEVGSYATEQLTQFYEQHFEVPLIRESRAFYVSQASLLKAENSCSDYMGKVLQLIDHENLLCTKFLHPSSVAKVQSECQQCLVADHLVFLTEKADDMLQIENCKDLSNMYRLLHCLPSGMKALLEHVERHIRCTGVATVKNLFSTDVVPSSFVDRMLDVHCHFSELIHHVFNNDQNFLGVLDMACAHVINRQYTSTGPCRSPELLSRYCDTLLRKNAKIVFDAELDDKLSMCVTIFKYLDDKDVFQKFYSRLLAKRLIYSTSQSMDSEECMINKLKNACGYEFTNKLHRMFTDVSVSNDHNTGFQEFLNERGENLDVNFSVMILQAGAWPIANATTLTFNLPPPLEHSVRQFESYYNAKFNGRKLTWLHAYFHGELKCNHLKKPYIVSMASTLMAIMLCFNSDTKLSFFDILSATGIAEKDLQKQLMYLCEMKLLDTQADTGRDSLFNLNMAYSNKRTKFKLNFSMPLKETAQEMERIHMAADEDRRIFLQAVVVRVMKARKVMKHNLLIQEVITQSACRFQPNVGMIKKCIESLIDKQYLERSQDAADEYHYVA